MKYEYGALKGFRAGSTETYRRDIGPYTIEVFRGYVSAYRSGWRKGLESAYDRERNVRECRFHNNPERLPK